MKGSDGYIRKVKIEVCSELDNKGRRMNAVTTLERPIHKLVLLVENCKV